MQKLSYEECLELKEAGFPQTTNAGETYYDTRHSLHVEGEYSYGDMLSSFDGCIKCPTLEELIEACEKEGEFALNKVGYGPWWASARDRASVNGATPIQAAKNLWLALNKK